MVLEQTNRAAGPGEYWGIPVLAGFILSTRQLRKTGLQVKFSCGSLSVTTSLRTILMLCVCVCTHTCVHVTLTLGLVVCATMSYILCGYWGSNSSLHAWKASTLTIELFPQPSGAFYRKKLTSWWALNSNSRVCNQTAYHLYLTGRHPVVLEGDSYQPGLT